MSYTPYLPNPYNVFMETILTNNFDFVLFFGWSGITLLGMFIFKLSRYFLTKFITNRAVKFTLLFCTAIVKIFIMFQFFPSLFDFTYYYFFIFLIILLFSAEYIFHIWDLKLIINKYFYHFILLFLIYAFCLVTVRNLYNSTFHFSDAYKKEEMLKYVR